jgi:hypothetical protein
MTQLNLTNQEIIFLFFTAKTIKEQYEKVYEDHKVDQKIPTKHGIINVETEVPEKVLDEMLQSNHYLYMKSIHDKLKPVYEIIKDVQPELAEEVEMIFPSHNY